MVNTSFHDGLEEYIAAYPEIISDQNNFIIFNINDNGFMEPIRRGQAWKIITTDELEAVTQRLNL